LHIILSISCLQVMLKSLYKIKMYLWQFDAIPYCMLCLSLLVNFANSQLKRMHPGTTPDDIQKCTQGYRCAPDCKMQLYFTVLVLKSVFYDACVSDLLDDRPHNLIGP
jgi:hypothetical protein